ncbi:MAG TPA: YbdD/YjiX family protein [Steroidobacteraceae bacterium]|nr:YbdD/YjiX family protein [Steroidobacteraceae bacterium]
MRWLRALWRGLRAVSGDDAYERYLVHHARAHPGVEPLSRRAFYLDEEQRKWSSVNRCC